MSKFVGKILLVQFIRPCFVRNKAARVRFVLIFFIPSRSATGDEGRADAKYLDCLPVFTTFYLGRYILLSTGDCYRATWVLVY